MTTENKKIYDLVEVDDDYFAEKEEETERFYSYIKTLPAGILNILFGLETPNILEKISLNYGLSPIQSASLSRLIRKVLIGEIYIRDFTTQISSALNLEQSRAKELGDTVATELFQLELEDIKKVQAQKFPAPVPISPPPPPKVAPHPTASQPRIIPPPPLSRSILDHPIGGDLPETHGNIIDLRKKP